MDGQRLVYKKKIKIEILFGRRKYILGSKYLCLECGEIYDSDWLNNNELFEMRKGSQSH